MIKTEQEQHIHSVGKELSEKLVGFFGRVCFNIKNGTYINCNIEQSLLPEPEKQEKKDGR